MDIYIYIAIFGYLAYRDNKITIVMNSRGIKHIYII